LAVSGQHLGELPGIEASTPAGAGDDMIRLRHRWWLLCESVQTADDTASSSAGAVTDLSIFYYGRDIIKS
jgi:hypothetical protein